MFAHMTFKTIPWKFKEGTVQHETLGEAQARAQKVANRTGDWVLIEGTDGTHVYVQPSTQRRRA